MSKTTRLLLIRHGESRANREDVFSGHYDVELEERGKMQARLTAEYIVTNYQVDKVYASDLKRAYATGKAVADLLSIDVIAKKGLREINGGKWEAVKFSDLPKLYPNEYRIWREDFGNAYCVGGESAKALAKRVYETVIQIAKENEGKTVVVATHATPIRALQSVIQTGGTQQMQQIPWVNNASVSELEYQEGKWSYGKIGYDEHLQGIQSALSKDI